MEWKKLAPDIIRQRVVIEGTTDKPITPDQIAAYLSALSEELNMRALQEPFVYQAEDVGHGAWIHWITSGAHFYTYNNTTPPLFTVDAYTCKPFSAERAAEFTKKYFKSRDLVWKEIEI
ncbi:MAG: S-adenosylmethionine decarboxylase [Candidatus Kerfeldbacteria bacterium]